MNKLFLIFLILINLKGIAQTNYSEGFNAGYKNGYCHKQGIGCIKPIPPVTPTPRLSELEESYTDGYNRGFEMGLNDAKEANSKTTRETSKNSTITTSEFKSLSYDEMLSVPMALQKRYDENQKYLYKMKKWIIELKSQIYGETYIQQLNKVNNTLTWLEDKDLARSTRELNQCEIKISEIINSYNNTISKAIYSTQVKTATPLRAKPDSNSENLQWCPIGTKVQVLNKSERYYQVSVGGKTGYILKIFLSDF